MRTDAAARTEPWIGRYLAGVIVTVAVVVSQYVVPASSPIVRLIYGNTAGSFLLVYGVPILTFVVLVGQGPLRGWIGRLRTATVVGLGWFGALALLGLLVTFVLVIVYSAIDPAALQSLSRENPALRQAAADPWLYVALSFVVGACEETIFRGWIFGTWSRHAASWVVPAVVTSALFAAVHLYYGFTYGVASPFVYVQLFLMGYAFAATYRASGGNLLVPAVLHGLYDAISFATLLSPTGALIAHFVLILGAAAVGLAYVLKNPQGAGGRSGTAGG